MATGWLDINVWKSPQDIDIPEWFVYIQMLVGIHCVSGGGGCFKER